MPRLLQYEFFGIYHAKPCHSTHQLATVCRLSSTDSDIDTLHDRNMTSRPGAFRHIFKQASGFASFGRPGSTPTGPRTPGRSRTLTLKKQQATINRDLFCFFVCLWLCATESKHVINEPKIILASSSPRRRLLLRQIGLDFEVIPADIGEEIGPDDTPADAVEALSLQKAELISGHPEVAQSDGNLLVIGADTIVVRDGKILGKPEDAAHAAAMLRSLSGRTHQVYTGVALVYRITSSQADEQKSGDRSNSPSDAFRQAGSHQDTVASLKQKGFLLHSFHERTDVTFGSLSDEEIAAYVNGGSPMDKAGAYGIQDDLGALFVERISGDYYNVVGFPLFRFYREVNNFFPGIVTAFESVQNT